MTTTNEIPITVEDLHIDPTQKSVQLSANRFEELVEYVDHLESSLSLAELDLKREREFERILLTALRDGYSLLHEIPNYYGEGERRRYHDLLSQVAEEARREVQDGNMTDRQFEELIRALQGTTDHRNGVAEGGVGV